MKKLLMTLIICAAHTGQAHARECIQQSWLQQDQEVRLAKDCHAGNPLQLIEGSSPSESRWEGSWKRNYQVVTSYLVITDDVCLYRRVSSEHKQESENGTLEFTIKNPDTRDLPSYARLPMTPAEAATEYQNTKLACETYSAE